MTTLLSWQQLSYQDQDGKLLLKPMSACIKAGERIVLQGASGSGKTLLLRCLARLNRYHCQSMLLNGCNHHTINILQWRKSIAAIMQTATMIEGRVIDNLQLPFSFKHHQKKTFNVKETEEKLKLFEKNPDFLNRDINKISGGERQIINILRTIQLEPSILLLDEPTSALDKRSRETMQQIILNWVNEKKGERAFIWVSHDPIEIKTVANRYWEISKDGQLTSDINDDHA